MADGLSKFIQSRSGKQVTEDEFKRLKSEFDQLNKNKKVMKVADRIKKKRKLKKKDRKDFKGQKEVPNARMKATIAEDIRKIKSLK